MYGGEGGEKYVVRDHKLLGYELALTVELVEGSISEQQWLQTLASNISYLQETLNQQIKHLRKKIIVHNTIIMKG